MQSELNEAGQPVGLVVSNWVEPGVPPREVMEGTYCRVEPLATDRHARSLFEANSLDREGRNWTYLSCGPFETFASYLTWLTDSARLSDTLFFTIVEKSQGRAVGLASYLNIAPPKGSIEVGHLNFSPLLQRTPAATEAMYLMMRAAFNLGYRRYEWKCNALNVPSRRAAQRLGLSFEGIFRQATIVKGRNRDTAWYAAIDQEWPALQAAFLQWLNPANFDGDGRQRVSLSTLTAPILKHRG